jgi:pimeloyl-ACP methyl ester carboxylesterase
MKWSTRALATPGENLCKIVDGAASVGESFATISNYYDKGRGTHRGIMHFHGRGGTANLFSPLLWDVYEFVHLKLADQGYRIIGHDCGGTDSWGNLVSINRSKSIMDLLSPQLQDTMWYVIGYSMGGGAACNFMRVWKDRVAGASLFNPAVNVDWMHAGGTYTAGIDAAYAAQGGWTASKNNHDPAIFGAQLVGKKIFAYTGSQDVTVPSATITPALALMGAYVTVRPDWTHTNLWATNFPIDELLQQIEGADWTP